MTTISTAVIAAPIDNVASIAATMAASTSAATRKAYAVAQRGYLAYCAERRWAPYPDERENADRFVAQVLSYLQAKVDAGCAVSTITKTLAGLRYFAAQESELASWALGGRAVRAFMAGVARERKGARVKRAAAFTRDDLARLHDHLRRAGTVRALRDRALVGLGIAAALRSQSIVDLNLGDVTRAVSVDGLNVAIHWSKTDQTGEGRVVTVKRSTNRTLDPVAAVEAWMRHLRSIGWQDGDPLFPRVRGSLPQRDRIGNASDVVTDLVRQLVVAAELATPDEAARYSSHSLRSSFATMSARARVPAEQVAKITGHSSIDTLRRYDRTSHELAAQVDYLGG